MKVAFILSMPNRASWNGRWSGEDNVYARVKSFTTKKAKEKAMGLIGNHYYRWSDGWGANVKVKEVDAKEARRLSRVSQGFCGYDWMIDSLLLNGAIYASHDEIPKQEVAA